MIYAVLSAALTLTSLVVVDGPRPDPVTVQGQGAQKYWAAKTGMTLYVFEGDGQGAYCTGECLQAWPPLVARDSDKPVGDWKPVTRPGGLVQWAYKGRPVYTYRGDTTAGQAAGDDIQRAWHALEYAVKPPELAMPPAAQLHRRTGGAYAVTDYRGMSLYAFSRDGKAPACTAECLEVWPPLRAPTLATAIGDWTPVDRPDGVRQWAYQGKLVYAYSEDQSPGDARGADADGVWKTVLLPAESGHEPPVTAKTAAPTDAARPGL